MKVPKKKLQEIASDHSSDTEIKDLMKLYKNYTKEPFLFLINDTILTSDSPLRIKKIILRFILK